MCQVHREAEAMGRGHAWRIAIARVVASICRGLQMYFPFHTTGGCPTVRSFFGGGTASQVSPFHLSCSHYRQTAIDWTQYFNGP